MMVMMEAGSGQRGLARDAAEIVGTLIAVTALAGAALRALDALPGLLRREGRGLVRVDSLEAAERLFGEPLLEPAFFPDTIAWPPAIIWVHKGPPVAVVAVFTGRDGRIERLRLCAVRGPGLPEGLLPPAHRLHRVAVEMQAETAPPAVLDRVQIETGAIAHDLVWSRGDLTVALRYTGSADELVAIARSLRRRRP